MTIRKILFFRLLLPVLTAIFLCPAGNAKRIPDSELFNSKANDVVYFVPQFSNFKEISHRDMLFLKKVMRKADRKNVKAVIVELDTPGGEVNVALKYVSLMAKSEVPIIVYLNPQGISAGMIIAMAADRIAINPNGVIGDAMPLQLGVGGVKPITDEPEKKNDGKKSDKPEKEQKAEKKTDGEKKKTDETKKPAGHPDIDKILKELKKLREEKKSNNQSEKEKKLVNQKFLTVFFKVLQVLAEKNDRPVRVVRAMADPYQRLTLKKDGIEHTKDSPLTLSAEEAKKLHVVDYIARNKHDLLSQLGLGNCEVQVVEKNALEQVLAFLTYPALASALLILGFLGLYVEIKTPGFGVPGTLGIVALTLFFLGHTASGASDWGPIVIFFVGLFLLAMEVFVIPGFGIVGILGITCMIVSLFGAFGFENFTEAAHVIGISLLVALVLMIFLTIYVLPKSSLFKHLRLETVQQRSKGYSAPHQEHSELIGRTGIAHTPLRPTGVVIIDEQRYDAATEGDFIEKDETVEAVALNGFQIKVKKVQQG